MRYALLSTVAAAVLSLSVAAVAQGTGSSGGTSGGGGPGSGGGAAGGSAGSGAATGGATPGGSGPGAATSGRGAPSQGPGPSVGTGASGAATSSASGSAASVNVTPEQRTQITRSFTSVNVRPVTGINFAVAVGTVIPETIELHEVPAEVVRVVPAYGGYRYFVVGKQIVIVEPKARRIVAVLERTG
jgi:Protein of unknown function (DUF1236)